MNTTSMTTAPMVRIHPRLRASVRPSIEELLEETRITSPTWWARLEDAHLSVASSSPDPMTVVGLIADAPNERLAGFVEGLHVNQN